jgi:hypothetical protein
MRDEAFQRELARRRTEAEDGDTLSVVNRILDDIAEDLSHSVVDNRAKIAEVDQLLGLTPDATSKRTNGDGAP